MDPTDNWSDAQYEGGQADHNYEGIKKQDIKDVPGICGEKKIWHALKYQPKQYLVF